MPPLAHAPRGDRTAREALAPTESLHGQVETAQHGAPAAGAPEEGLGYPEPVAAQTEVRPKPRPSPQARMGARAALAASALPKKNLAARQSGSARAIVPPARAIAPPAPAAAPAGPGAEHPAAETAGEAPEPDPRGTTALFASVFGLVVVLVFNVFGWRFDAWSLLPATRGIYEVACDVIGCDVDSPNAPGAWDLRAKAVTRPGAPEPLTLDVELTNQAPYRQTLPTVAVRFTNDAGELIAEERLTPRDYADRPAQRFAPGAPKSLRLRFAEPGAEASRYQISLL